jgi:glycosyltransferase involved in cell wall biosynthesis
MPFRAFVPEPKENITKSFRHWCFQKYVELFEFADLPILKTLKKGICVTYQGDDARQKEFSLKNFEITAANHVDENYYPPGSDKIKQERIALFDKYADRIYAVNPDLLHVLPARAEFLPYANIDIREWRPTPKENSRKPVLIHAPTSQQAKGTVFILQAVERLKAEGVPFEFVLVEGLPNSEARKLYERADLLVDQLLIGWYGGIAVELMALAKPVVCFVRDSDLKFIPTQMRDEIPIINANPNTIYKVLKDWLTIYRDRLPEVGEKSRAYVESWHDPIKIATRLRKDYETIVASK